jgi:hypothetical protein
MPQIFSVDENIWCEALTDILKRLEKKRKDKTPGELVEVRHMYELLGISAWLDGEREMGEPEIINLKAGVR